MSLRARFAELMYERAEIDERLVVLVSDISHGLFRPFAERYPDRYYNIGICEPSIVNLAAGLAHLGLKPVVHTIAPFLIERCFEQIKLDFGYQRRSLTLASVGSAFDYGQLGCSHHAYADASLIAQIPGSRVFLPSSTFELDTLFAEAFDLPGINYFRLTEHAHEHCLEGWSGLVGAGVQVRTGADVTIAVVGARLSDGIDACDALGLAGISCDVLYFPTLKPFDSHLLASSARKTKRVITVEELSSRDGLYARVVESCVGLDGLQVRSLAITDFIHEYGTYRELCEAAGIDARSIVQAGHEVVNG